MDKEIGAERQVCTMSLRFYISVAVLLVGCLGTIALICYQLYSNSVHVMKPEDRRGAGVIAWMCGAGALLFLYTLWDNRGARVALHEKGLATNLRGKKNRFLWADVLEMRAKITDKYVNGIKASTIRQYNITLTDGTQIAIPPGLQKVAEVGETIEAEVYPLVFRRIADALDRGEKVEFRKWTLSPRAFGLDQKETPWSEIASINIARGVITVTKKDGSVLCRRDYGDMPNAPIFLQLGERLRKGP